MTGERPHAALTQFVAIAFRRDGALLLTNAVKEIAGLRQEGCEEHASHGPSVRTARFAAFASAKEVPYAAGTEAIQFLPEL
jgi:hypothetical protein